MENIIGSKITEVRKLNDEELAYEGWEDQNVVALVLDNGCVLYASQDEEGNSAGSLFGRDTKNNKAFLVIPPRITISN